MVEIARGRVTHQPWQGEGPMAVFLIGVRIHKLHRVDRWLPVARAMVPMIEELAADPASGFLGARTTIEGRGPLLVQYWRSVEDIYRYASDPEQKHRPAWAAFNRRTREIPGVIGVWHETYEIARAESVYVDMPLRGLPRVLGDQPVGRRGDKARDRITA